MYRIYAPTTEDIDNFSFAASGRLHDLLRGELDLDAEFDCDLGDAEGDF
jgi:hypothetical protein